MKDALVVEFQEVFDTTLVMRVVHQDDAKIKRGKFRYIHDTLCIESVDSPEIFNSVIYIRGTSLPCDNKESVIPFNSTEKRTAYLTKAKAAIAALNESLADKPLTFERIRKECVSGESILVDGLGNERVFVGFLSGELFTSKYNHRQSEILTEPWTELSISNWKIKGAK